MCEMHVATVIEDTDEEVAFLGSLSAEANDSSWMTDIQVENLNARFKIDTGADVTAISETLYNQGQFSKLEKSTRVLLGPRGTRLDVKGKFTDTLRKNSKNTKEEIYVVEGLCTPLLGGLAAVALQLVTRINNVSLDSKDSKKEFPKLFCGLGKMEGEYNTVLKPGAQPFSLSTPRRISLPLLPKVREELDRMEQQGVISKVEGPTEWLCAYGGGAETHGQGQLTGAKVLSKLDTNAGFWQIPLSKESTLLTTFITPFGWYCYNRLCFGISSAPEHFQKHMSCILEGLVGVLCQMDDVLIWGATQTEHDERLWRVLSRLQEAGVTLNDKCEFSKSRIKNVIFERAKFNQRQQGMGESADSFHTALHCLAEHCGYTQDWGFSHVTSSPHFPQSNGEAEHAVRTIKSLLKKSSDPYLALMAYQAAPLAPLTSGPELMTCT
ncbi:interleukin-1 receptor accessory protein-like 1-A [Pimephales promelas]|nr:interleukin-1 receptor accessory protein-like 1-A [Pimephales promelas]